MTGGSACRYNNKIYTMRHKKSGRAAEHLALLVYTEGGQNSELTGGTCIYSMYRKKSLFILCTQINDTCADPVCKRLIMCHH